MYWPAQTLNEADKRLLTTMGCAAAVRYPCRGLAPSRQLLPGICSIVSGGFQKEGFFKHGCIGHDLGTVLFSSIMLCSVECQLTRRQLLALAERMPFPPQEARQKRVHQLGNLRIEIGQCSSLIWPTSPPPFNCRPTRIRGHLQPECHSAGPQHKCHTDVRMLASPMPS